MVAAKSESIRLRLAATAATFALTAIASLCVASEDAVRIAAFNVSLYGQKSGQIAQRLHGGDDPQARTLAEIIQRVRPDVLLLSEFDYDVDGKSLKLFCDEYLNVGQNFSQSPNGPAEPIGFAYRFTAPVNTGAPSGFDLDNDGRVGGRPGTRDYGVDCWGFGLYPGQYGMAILSRFPIARDRVRTFQRFLWKDMPGARLPDDAATDAPHDWYSEEELAGFRLSSKSHWDVPVNVDGQTLHLLASHPTPPVFDGPEDRNGRRNADEIRFWLDYTGPLHRAAYIYDDSGRRGGVPPGARFVILGDLNGDPHDGQGSEGISLLLAAPQLLDYPPPTSAGAVEQAQRQAGANRRHEGDPGFDTLDGADRRGPGNLRLDYVLPSANLRVADSGVFWPKTDDPLFPLVGEHPFPGSDHRLVWIDLMLGKKRSE